MSETKNTAAERAERVFSKLQQKSALKDFAQEFLWAVAKELEVSQGAFFIAAQRDGIRYLRFVAGYAYHLPESETIEYEFGEGLSGQVAKEGKAINLSTVPDGYISILSGLGKASPNSMIIFPLKHNDEVIAVFELASFHAFGKEEEEFLSEVSAKAEQVFNEVIEKSK
ncbi:MAG: GAF domain-containing protein [Bacteroidetes bacterium]|nr:GAF domain-containing protein [Bacteroidota bacterium]